MPFHAHHQQNATTPGSSAASGVYQAAQALGSIGAPAGNLRVVTSGTNPGGSDVLLPGSGNVSAHHSGGAHTTPSSSSGLHLPGSGTATGASNSQAYDSSKRTQALGRNPEELHISGSTSSSAMGQYPSSQSAQQSQQPSQQQQLYSSDQYSAPNINLQEASSNPNPHYAPSQPASTIPSSLQPGSNTRPSASSTYTAPVTVPTIPHINTNAQQYTLPTRSNTMNTSHSYSRSSPAGLEQKYIPFTNTPDTPKYPQNSGQKFYNNTAQTPTGAASNSPLGLSDIRPRANSNLVDDTLTGIFAAETEKVPTNSNYLAPWGVYAYDWCKWPLHGGNTAGKMAVGSYLEDTHNFIQILDTQIIPQEVREPGAPGYGLEYVKVAEATCSYPVTRILWEPPSSQKQSTDLLATSGDHLRLWSLPQTSSTPVSNSINRSSSANTRDPPPQKLTPLALLSNSKSPEHTAPLTSLDWNTLSPKLIITSSIDTTCTIWDIPTLTAKTQLIAHDKEVFDVRFCAGSVDVFVSCGADGSVRMFDLRSLEHSTIIYEPSDKQAGDKDKGNVKRKSAHEQQNQLALTTMALGSPGGRMSPTKAQQTMSYAPPLLRIAASPHDSHLLATFAADSDLIRILDVRQPGQALLELRGHGAAVNSIEWSPSRRGMLASGGDDSLVMIWDLIHSHNGAQLNGNTGPSDSGTGGNGYPAAPASSTTGHSQINQKGPYASWRCDYEVSNLSWAPQSGLTAQGGEWIGICGGRGVWGVKL